LPAFRRPFTFLSSPSVACAGVLLAALLAAACSAENGGGEATGGTGAVGTTGGAVGTGGTTPSTGGTPAATGGTAANTGGTPTATGGTAANTGGTSSATGGTTGNGGSVSTTGGNAGRGGSGGSATGGASGGSGGKAATGGSGGGGGRGGTGGTTGTGGGSATGGSSGQGKVWSQCRFHFGTIDSKAKSNPALIKELDMFTPGWIGQSDSFDMKYLCDEAASPFGGVVPAMVAYVIAFTARRDQGLQDCNVSGTTNLCKYGATYIRGHKDRILTNYATYAKGFAQACGISRPLIWMMEPDYYQYSVGGDAQALSAKEAGEFMTQIVATVKQNLPNAVFSLDVSPWMPNNGRDWYSNFTMGDFTFVNTSGGGTDANNAKIRSVNAMTWAGVRMVTGKPILADTGYGAAGASAGHDALWDAVANINARIADGVVSITQYNPNSNWASTISQIRPQLNMGSCP
jgi:hypothetical protein